jgi:hypothetical protein
MGTLAALPIACTVPSDVECAEGRLKNAATGFARALEATCRARVVSRYPPIQHAKEKVIHKALLDEIRGEIVKVYAEIQKTLESRLEKEEWEE